MQYFPLSVLLRDFWRDGVRQEERAESLMKV